MSAPPPPGGNNNNPPSFHAPSSKKANAPMIPEPRPGVYYSSPAAASAATTGPDPIRQNYSSSQQNYSNAGSYQAVPAGAIDTMEPEQMCRLCLDAHPINDLIVPCKCSGSMKYVHRRCLDKWRALSPKSTSFYQCDQCLAKYQFVQMGSSTSILTRVLQYLKYFIFVTGDLCIFIGIWQLLVLICSGIYWVFDSLALDGYTEENVFPNLPNPLQYYIYGVGLFFFFLGVMGLMYGTFLLLRRCIGSSSSNRSNRSNANYSPPVYYGNDFWYSDFFLLWFLFSAPGPSYHGGGGFGGCDFMLMPFACCTGCDVDCPTPNCPSIGSGGGGGSDNGGGILAVLAAILIIIVVLIIILGVAFGTCMAVLFVIAVTRRHYVVLRKKDECKRFIVKDLENPNNNRVIVGDEVV